MILNYLTNGGKVVYVGSNSGVTQVKDNWDYNRFSFAYAPDPENALAASLQNEGFGGMQFINLATATYLAAADNGTNLIGRFGITTGEIASYVCDYQIGQGSMLQTTLRLDASDLNLGGEDSDLNFEVNDYYSLRHSYSVAVIWRQYIPLGRNKRFALFNEMQLSGGGTQARFAKDSPVKGTYETGYTFSLGVSPGIVAFATNNMAVEVNVGVMGITYTHTKQVHNQVTVGKRDASMMNFKVNIFSIGLGMAFYL